MPNLNNHFAQAELDRIAPLFMFSPQAKTFADIEEYAKIDDFGGFIALRVDGSCAQIIDDAGLEILEVGKTSLIQLDANNSIVDVLIIAPDFTMDTEVDLATAYSNAIENGMAYYFADKVRTFEDWKGFREDVLEYVEVSLANENEGV